MPKIGTIIMMTTSELKNLTKKIENA
jgi:hypothetical protein